MIMSLFILGTHLSKHLTGHLKWVHFIGRNSLPNNSGTKAEVKRKTTFLENSEKENSSHPNLETRLSQAQRKTQFELLALS